MEEQHTHGQQSPAALPDEAESALPLLAWGLFWRMIFAQAAPLFLLAAIICFFAFNWANMPAFAKFGVLGAALAASAGLALWRGLESTAGSIALLFCGICAGPLLAVYGQVYQTGADDWELFRAWCLFLLPLAILGRQSGLCLAIWVTGNLWALLYLDMTGINTDNMALYLAAGQTAALFAWETAARILAGEQRPFLQARWFPRLMILPPLLLLTAFCAMSIVEIGTQHSYFPYHRFQALYAAFMTFGAFFYTRIRRDLFMIACGLLSLLILATAVPFVNIIQHGDRGLSLRLFSAVLILTGGGAALVRLLKHLHKQAPVRARDAATSLSPALRRMRFALTGSLPATHAPDEGTERVGAPEWLFKGLAGLCAWLALPFLVGLVIFLFGPDENMFIFHMLIVMALGIAYSRAAGSSIFAQQAALCLALTGTLGAGIAIASVYPDLAPYAPLSLLFAVGACCARSAVYRYLAAAIGLPVLAATLLFIPPDGRIQYRFQYADGPLPLLFFFLFCLILALTWSMAPAGQNRNAGFDAWRRQTLAGCHLALLAMGLVLPQWPHLLGLYNFDGSTEAFHEFWTTVAMIGVASAAGLACFTLRLGRQLALSRLNQALLIAISVALAAVSWKLPWFGAHVFALALARHAASLPLIGLTIFSFAVSINLEYYFQNSTLLDKSFSLACAGLLLAAAAAGLHMLLRSGTGKGLLPDPRLLFPEGLTNAPGQESKDPPRQETAEAPGKDAKAVAQGKEAAGAVRDSMPRRIVLFAVLALFFSFFTWSVLQKEQLKAKGDLLVLALAPRDPRSLMQGDYMVLRFRIESTVSLALPDAFSQDAFSDDSALPHSRSDGSKASGLTGAAVVEVAQDRSVLFKRIDDGSPLKDGEKRLIFRKRQGQIRIGAGAFFFQEGHGKLYEKAKFAELRVNEAGESLITRLLDEDMKPIEAEKTP